VNLPEAHLPEEPHQVIAAGLVAAKLVMAFNLHDGEIDLKAEVRDQVAEQLCKNVESSGASLPGLYDQVVNRDQPGPRIVSEHGKTDDRRAAVESDEIECPLRRLWTLQFPADLIGSSPKKRRRVPSVDCEGGV
jgi:hypothetical protein